MLCLLCLFLECSVLSLLKEWKVEGFDLKKHEASGDLESFAFDLASLLMSLFMCNTHEKIIEHAPETIKVVADELRNKGIVRLTQENRCEMIKPSVVDYLGFLSAVVDLGLLFDVVSVVSLRSFHNHDFFLNRCS